MKHPRHIIASAKKASALALVAIAVLCLLPASARAEERQYKVEAAFLYNFFNYITWPGYATPQDLQAPVVCIYGNDPLLPYLEYMRGKMASERSMTLREVSRSEDVHGCNILFMRHRMAQQMHSLPGDTLTVLKPDDPLDAGGMIALNEDGERISIDINQNELAESGFKVSSRLLDIAQSVKR